MSCSILRYRQTMQASLVPELICSNFERSLIFYTKVLGFSLRYTRQEERFAYLERDGAELMIEQPRSQERLFPRAALAHPYGRGIHLQILVTDVVALHQSVEASGTELFLPLERRWYRRQHDSLEVLQFAIQDPDGYLLRFSQMMATAPHF